MRRKGTQDWKRPEAKQKGTHGPVTGFFFLRGAMPTMGVQATGVERTGQVEVRAEGQGRKERELRIKESQNLWAILVPVPSLSGTVHKPFLFPSVCLKTMVPSVLNPGLSVNGRWGVGARRKTHASIRLLSGTIGKS